MAELPFILAGPIVRRVTPKTVSVWIALSKKAKVKLSIWDKVVSTGTGTGTFNEASDPPLHTSALKDTIRIGNKLHITVITIDLSAPQTLLPGKLYAYNLSFSGDAGSSDLKSNKLLEDKSPTAADPLKHLALGYQQGMLPTFVLPPLTIDKLNLVHGSCRKAHGYGKDSLAVLDTLIKKAVLDNDPDKRPHQLYLTGDQIYADEVPILLSQPITTLGAELLGLQEKLKVKRPNGTVEDIDATQQNFPVLRRQQLIYKIAKFTSDAAINHLLSFGEFAATYIMYWSNAVWPKELYDDEALKTKEDFLTVLDTTAPTEDILNPPPSGPPPTPETPEEKAKRIAREKEKYKEQYKVELADVQEFRNKLPQVRRALANVPVFMMMDDHEVTDDWFITRNSRDLSLTSPLGVTVMRNALMSYALFQDWGNDPSTYNSGAKADLLTQLQAVFPAGSASGPDSSAAAQADVSFGFNLNDETTPPIKWHYSVPCSETNVYVLDTRTRRTFETRYSPPGLMTNSAMDEQIPINPQPEKFLIIVSPAPVLGLGIIEELLQPAVTVFKDFEADPEPWSFSPVVFEKFLDRLQKFKRVIFLSGDVHFGMTLTLDYWKKGEPKPTRLVQLVSSGLKHQKFDNDRFLISGMTQKLLRSTFYPAERLGWHLRAGLNVTNPAGKTNSPRHRIRLRKEPVLLPTTGWPENSTASQPPDWSWRLQMLADQRPDDTSPNARPKKVQIKSFTPDVDPATGDPGEAYTKILGRHIEIFKNSVSRDVAWDSNIGLLKFKTDGLGNITLTHELWYLLPQDEADDDPDAYTVFTTSLEPVADTPPVIH